ncbi:hypothetical protein AVEN_210869-1 [Araneus ventricosus]|uniref:Uncharacterized protein n=1 Tax=Araneus ventricosus TaxID=182803 RepID=A0A4Y2RZ71_ARAVE|nr:hypothetical protein AVEN_210869-1 [Araneus ventricosus]
MTRTTPELLSRLQSAPPHQREQDWHLRMTKRATGPIHDGSSVESGFEPTQIAQQSKRGALQAMPSLFTFRSAQPPEIGAMAKITLLHCMAQETATPSSRLTSLWMKIRNRDAESCVYRNALELQSSRDTNR